MATHAQDPLGPLPDLSQPAAEGVGIGACPEVPGYEILRVLGEGGMGVVYLARQKSPLQRQVALKIVKPGMDSKQVIARFEAERQALALLDHPNIAHVYEAGTTKDARPYFVMEYVNGASLTDFCDQRRLSLAERLGLFAQVCAGVQHAHDRGILHRDLKPSNILICVDGDRSVPKIIDFGVAKALTAPLTDRTLVTEQDQLLGTPEYMSPEQAEMRKPDIDARSDVYSLGAVLYELLTGVPPFDAKALREGGIDHIRRAIRDEDPTPPSTRLSTVGAEEAGKIARYRRIEVAALTKQLRKELEWIPLKALRKEPSQRYLSALALADDIRHYLTDAPLVAGPPSALYRLRKFTRRHRMIFAAVTTAAAAIAIGIVVGADLRPVAHPAPLVPPEPAQAVAPNLEAGLVGWWKFDEGSGTTAHDSSGNGNDATLSGHPQWARGPCGGALSFDGVDDQGLAPAAGLEGLQQVTIAAFVNLNSWQDRIMRFVTISGGAGEVAVIRYMSRYLHFYMTLGGVHHRQIRVLDVLALRVFQHVAATYDGSAMRVYLDGREVSSLQVSGAMAPASHLLFGDVPEQLDGLLADVRIYNRALSETEIVRLAGVAASSRGASETTDPNLVGWWKLDEGSGTAAYDSSGHGNVGTLFGRPQWVAGGIRGALQFGGIGDYVDCGGGPSLDLTGEITVGAWVKTTDADSAQRNQQVIGKGGSYYLEYAKGDSGKHLVKFIIHDANDHGAGTITDSFDRPWHHLAGTYDGALIKCYVDGQLKSTADHVGHLDRSAAHVNIGRIFDSPGIRFTGTIDDVRIYNRALSNGEIADLAGTARPGPIGWWRLNEGSGATAHDSSDRNQHGSIYHVDGGLGTGRSVWANDPQRGTVLSFSGDDANGAFVKAGTMPPLDLKTDFSWSFWARQDGDATGSAEVIIGNRISERQDPQHWIKFTPRGFEYDRGPGAMSIRYDPIPGGIWLHHCVVKAGTHLTYYRNGVQGGTATVTRAMAKNPLYLGGYDVPGERWRGWLSDVRIYDRALSAAEVMHLARAGSEHRYNPLVGDASLVGWWKLDEGSGATALDSSGHANHGVLYGRAQWIAGKIGGALQFDGVDDYVNCDVYHAFDPSLDITKRITVAAWVKTETCGSNPQNTYIVSRGGSSYMLVQTDSLSGYTKMAFVIRDSNAWHAAEFPVSPAFNGAWHHLAGTYDGKQLKLYADGRLEATTNHKGNIDSSASPTNIGRNSDTNANLFSGAIDDVRIYNRALNAAEVARLVQTPDAQVESKPAAAAANGPAQTAAGETDGAAVQPSEAGWSRPASATDERP